MSEEKKKIYGFGRIAGTTKATSKLATKTTQIIGSNASAEKIETARRAGEAKGLREISNTLAATVGEYYRLQEYFGNLLTCKYVVLPSDVETVLDPASFMIAEKKVLDYASSASITSTSIEIIKTVINEGVFYGHEMDLNGEIVLIKLPPDYCRTRFKIKGVHALEVNLKMFQNYRGADLIEILESVPKEIAKAYNDYVAGSITEWFLADIKSSRVHFLNPELTPLLAPVFGDVANVNKGKESDRANDAIKLRNIVSQRIPVNKEGEITLEMEDIIELHKNAISMIVADNLDVVTTPCELEMLEAKDTFGGRAETISEREIQNLHSAAGTNSALLGGPAKGSIGLEKSIEADAALLLPLLLQFEAWYKIKLESISKIPFVVLFSPSTNLTIGEWFTRYKDGAAMGQPTKLLAASMLGIPQSVMAGALAYENEYLKLIEKMLPNQSAYTQPGTETETDVGGAPVKTEVTEEGADTQIAGKNE